jgi:hypothetical protein
MLNQWDVAQLETMAMEVNTYATILGAPNPINATSLRIILTAAFEYASGEFGIRAAQDWGNKFTFPPALLQRDLQTFTKLNYDLP